MRKFWIVVGILAAGVGAAVFYLHATTPSASRGLRFPLSEEQRSLLARVPAGADGFALVPTAAVVRDKLVANPLTRDHFLEWAANAPLPRSWMLGSADLVAWRSGEQTSYAITLDPFRAALVRLYLMLGSGLNAQLSEGTLLINAGAGAPPGPARTDELLAMARGLEPADVLLVQLQRGSNAFPPIGSPSLTAIEIGPGDLNLVSVAPRSEETAVPAAVLPRTEIRFPRNALLAATFRVPPRFVSDLDRLFLTRVSHLLDDGGSIVLYDINTGTLLPRPKGLIVARNTAGNRALLSRIEGAASLFGQIEVRPDELRVALDQESMHRYEIETFTEARWQSNDWALRLDPARTAPLLADLGESTGLRLAAPRLYRSIRELRGWIGVLSGARSLEAGHSTGPEGERLRVRVTSK